MMPREFRASSASSNRQKRRFFEAWEPRGYDRAFYSGVLLLSFLLIATAVGFAVYRTAFNTTEPPSEPSFDLVSLLRAGAQPDPANPCIVVQQHLEASRRRSLDEAYRFLSVGLKSKLTYEEFASGTDVGAPLLDDIKGYRFGSYDIDGDKAETRGYILYRAGGRSAVEATLAREEGGWRISRITVVYR
jgi:hypothetical protein